MMKCAKRMAIIVENDRNAHEAIKRHDEESKAKQERVAQIKKLNHECAKVQSEMAKYTEQLEDCLKYKHFLDQLTPQQVKISAVSNSRGKTNDVSFIHFNRI